VNDVAGRLLGDGRYAEEGQADRDFRAYHCKAVCDIANVPELEADISIFLTEAKSFSMGSWEYIIPALPSSCYEESDPS
jgi:hypothetical protein